MEDRYTGMVCWFEPKKGYGFITWSKDNEPQKDLFVYYTAIMVEGFKTIKKGQTVSFSIGSNIKGQPIATDIKILNS